MLINCITKDVCFFWLFSESKMFSDFRQFVFSFFHNLFLNFLIFLLNRKGHILEFVKMF